MAETVTAGPLPMKGGLKKGREVELDVVPETAVFSSSIS